MRVSHGKLTSARAGIMMDDWHYLVQDGVHSPEFAYDEKAAVSAILSISGMHLCGNVVKYHIRRVI